jgi:hypothetical protein
MKNKNRYSENWAKKQYINSERAKELEWYKVKKKLQDAKEKEGIWVEQEINGKKSMVLKKK